MGRVSFPSRFGNMMCDAQEALSLWWVEGPEALPPDLRARRVARARDRRSTRPRRENARLFEREREREREREIGWCVGSRIEPSLSLSLSLSRSSLDRSLDRSIEREDSRALSSIRVSPSSGATRSRSSRSASWPTLPSRYASPAVASCTGHSFGRPASDSLSLSLSGFWHVPRPPRTHTREILSPF